MKLKLKVFWMINTLVFRNDQHMRSRSRPAQQAARGRFSQLQKMLQNTAFGQLIVAPEFLPNYDDIKYTFAAREKFTLVNLAIRAF